MKAFINSLYIHSILRFSLFTSVGLLFVLSASRLYFGARLIIGLVFAGFSAYYLYLLFMALSKGREPVDDYLEYSEYTVEELEDEYKHAVKMGPVKMGMMHIYYLTPTSAKIVPISEIAALELTRRRRGRYNQYYYILHITQMGDMSGDKLTFRSRAAAHGVVNSLRNRNPEIMNLGMDLPDPSSFF